VIIALVQQLAQSANIRQAPFRRRSAAAATLPPHSPHEFDRTNAENDIGRSGKAAVSQKLNFQARHAMVA
jgi:hypothetical protein